MKVEAFVTYKGTLDVGDVPWHAVEELLKNSEQNGSDYSLWDQGSEVSITSVELTGRESK